MLHRVLADMVVVVHFAFIVFVAIGSFLALKWPRLVWLHVPVAVYATVIVTIGFTCPLTPLEKHLRERAGQVAYDGGFVDRYLEGVIYPDRFIVLARLLVALLIVVGYTLLVRRRRDAL